MKPRVLALLLALPLVSGSILAQPVPIGSEFHVNTYTTDGQYLASVASGPGGDFIVVWTSRGSSGTDTHGASVQGQRYNAGGIAVGGEFQVNSFTTYFQFIPDLGIDAAGNFVVVWEGPNPSNLGVDFADIRGQRFAANGTPVDDEFQANSYTTGDQHNPAIAVAPDGTFVVVWDGVSPTEHRSGVFAQRFGTEGTPLGSEFHVNTYTTDKQRFPSIAMDADGSFVVVWESDGSAGSDTAAESKSVQGQRFAADGTPLGGEFQVNTYTTGHQYKASVAMDTDGDFVVVWRSAGVRGQRFSADGTSLGSEFEVSSFAPSSGDEPAVAMASADGFVVVWDGVSSGTDNDLSVQMRRFSADGTPSGDDFQVNTFTPNRQENAAVSKSAGGQFVVVWDSWEDDSSSLPVGVRGQRFDESLIFRDGFESGDTSDWSSTTP